VALQLGGGDAQQGRISRRPAQDWKRAAAVSLIVIAAAASPASAQTGPQATTQPDRAAGD